MPRKLNKAAATGAWRHRIPRIVSIDIDGTLIGFHPSGRFDRYGETLPGAVAFINAWRAKGFKIYLNTARPAKYRAFIKKILRERGLHCDHLSVGQKPIAAIYIDDRGYRFNGNWKQSHNELMKIVDWENLTPLEDANGDRKHTRHNRAR